MSKPDRHTQRKAVTHQKLLDATRITLIEKGYSQVDILDITEEANVSRGTFYKHFKNKEDCVQALIQQGFDALVAEISSSKQNFVLQPQWVKQSFSRIFKWAEENQELVLLMVGGTVSPKLNTFGIHHMIRVIKSHIMDNQMLLDEKEYPLPYPPDVLAQVATGMYIRTVGWWLENDTGYTAEEMGDMLSNILLFGIMPRAEG
jgi:AcrR family transcriptional regulator